MKNKVSKAFDDFVTWRLSLINTLITDGESFHKLLSGDIYYGPSVERTSKQWEVNLHDKLLAGLPPSTMRLNFTCDDMTDCDWLFTFTTHCDAWLLSVALNSGGFDKNDRQSLFKKINNLPTIHHVVCKVATKKVRANESNSEAGDEDEEGDEDDAVCDACGKYASCVFWIWCGTCKEDTILCNCNSCSNRPKKKCKSCRNNFALVVRRP